MTLSPQDRDLLKSILIERYNESVEKVPIPSGPFGLFDNATRSMKENILRSRLRPLPEISKSNLDSLGKVVKQKIMLVLWKEGIHAHE